MTLNPKLDSSCVLALTFDEESGNIAYDQSSYGNDGTIYGATRVRGIIGKALSFDGVDDYVEVADSESLDITDAITIEAWAKVNSWVNSYPRILAKKNAYSLYFNASTHRVEMQIYQSGSVKIVEAQQDLSLNTWYHIVGIYDSSTGFKIYINGNEVPLAGDTGTTGSIDSNANNVLIGQYEGLVRYFNGTIDEVRIYNRALSEKEIKTLYYYGIQSLRHAPYLLK